MKQYLWQELTDEIDWESRYILLIEFGKNLPSLDSKFKIEKYKIHGCQSRVWLVSEFNPETKLFHFQADSDALLVRGLLAIILDVYNNKTAGEILEENQSFLDKSGLNSNLSITRQQGIKAVLEKIFEVVKAELRRKVELA